MQKVKIELDQAEVNYLTDMFSEILRRLQNSANDFKLASTRFYERCDKENPEAALHFKMFSSCYSNYKKRMKEVKKLSEIQRKLKASVRKG